MSLGLTSALAAQTVPAPPTGGSHEAAILQIRVVEGEGAVHAAGSRASRGLVLEITDETGKPVSGAAVNFRLPDEGPGGVFANGMKTEVIITSPDGRAALWGMQWNHVEGPFQIRVTAAKGQARAGTVVSQYLSQAAAGKPSGATTARPVAMAGKSRSRWLWIGLIAAGAVGGGMAAGMSKGSTADAAGASTSPSVSVGAPSISVGKP
ncbi:MAG: hypothetical protein LLG20_09860 [Acidobacteriales bacterium]|nr:hypothetical protein [Terriglobales bacterium]